MIDRSLKSSTDSVVQRIGRLRTSNYDISNTCNLRCNGCLYFSGAGEEILRAEHDDSVWDAFFRSEAQRGINFAYVAGAEPSLVPNRIRSCHEHIPMGVIFTNGTKAIEPDIRYRIHVSLWGDGKGSKKYRGADINGKALRNYQGDERAIFVMTLNSCNLPEVDAVVRSCRDAGVKLTFSLFSPTTEYNHSQWAEATQDLRLNSSTLQACREIILKAAAYQPDTVVISEKYIDWVTQPESLYTLGHDNIALNCGNRLTKHHVHYNADLRRNTGKCCSPNLDCKDCRPYAMSLASYFNRRREFDGEWQGVWSFWSKLFLPLPPTSHERAPSANVSA